MQRDQGEKEKIDERKFRHTNYDELQEDWPMQCHFFPFGLNPEEEKSTQNKERPV